MNGLKKKLVFVPLLTANTANPALPFTQIGGWLIVDFGSWNVACATLVTGNSAISGSVKIAVMAGNIAVVTRGARNVSSHNIGGIHGAQVHGGAIVTLHSCGVLSDSSVNGVIGAVIIGFTK